MGRFYSIVGNASVSSGPQDILEITAPSDAILVWHYFMLGQTTDFGDAEEENLRVQYLRGVTSGSGGSASVFNRLLAGDNVTGATGEEFNSTISTGGTVNGRWVWNVRIPLELIFTPEMRLILPPSATGVFRVVTSPADAITCEFHAVIEEVGG